MVHASSISGTGIAPSSSMPVAPDDMRTSARGMRVLFLTQYPRLGPSSRYRVYQMIPYLESEGIECVTRPLVSERDYCRARDGGSHLWKTQLLMRGALKRLLAAREARDFDVVYVLKGVFPYGPPLCELMLGRTNVPLIFDFDDAIFLGRRSRHHPMLDWLKGRGRAALLCRMSDRVVVPNHYLASFAAQHAEMVTVLPEAEDTERLTPRGKHTNGGTLTIGWIGSPSTVKYLNLIEPALREICRRYPHVNLRVVGGEFSAEGVRSECVPWSLEGENALLHGFDVGIMPLPLEEWSLGKSGCKLRQYMAAGVPGVASRIGYNCELVEDGKTGLLVETNDEWVQALSRLIEDADLRNQLAQRARQSVVDRFAISVIGPQLIDILQKVAHSHRVGSPVSASTLPRTVPQGGDA